MGRAGLLCVEEVLDEDGIGDWKGIRFFAAYLASMLDHMTETTSELHFALLGKLGFLWP